MKNREIIKNINNLMQLQKDQSELIKKDLSLPRLPLKVVLAINRNKKRMIDEYKTYESTLSQYLAENNTNINSIASLSQEEQTKIMEEINNLQDVDVNIEIAKISECDFGDYIPTLEELDVLSFMIEF